MNVSTADVSITPTPADHAANLLQYRALEYALDPHPINLAALKRAAESYLDAHPERDRLLDR